MSELIGLNVKIKSYTGRVLGVLKEKYALKDKGEALDKFAELYGDEFVDREVKDEVIKEFMENCDRHIKKYGFRNRTTAEIRKKIEGR